MALPAATKGRLTVIDALRGVAAGCVILPHFVGFFSSLAVSGHRLGSVMLVLGDYGHYGVDIFFVVSGFVIAFTTQERPLTWHGVPNFMLRRLTRLAPPYWASILLVLAVLCLQAVLGSSPHRLESALSLLAAKAPAVVVHLFYLQDLLGLANLNAVYWTLCIEVQFYLAFALGVVVWRQEGRKKHLFFLPGTVILFLSWLVSVLLWLRGWKGIPGTFLPFWHEFALGILACRLVGGRPRASWEEAVTVGMLGLGIAAGVMLHRPGLLVALLTFGVIWFFGGQRRLQTALNWPSLQFLGRISYSLYLVHIPFGTVFLGIKTRLVVHDNVAADCVLFFLAVACSLGGAVVFYRIVEVSATALSQQFKPV